MANWTAQVFENEYLAEGASDVHAVVTVGCTDAGTVASSGDAAEVLIIDTSGSMMTPHSKIASARTAAAVAIDAIADGTYFAVVSGTSRADVIYPTKNDMVRADSSTRRAAKGKVARLGADGGTAIGAWLQLADWLFKSVSAAKRHAILLTDGKNGEDHPDFLRVLADLEGRFQCDCRGVGADWEVNELRLVASALLGSVGLIANPNDMADDIASMMHASMARGVASA
jgi:hypothetical protein